MMIHSSRSIRDCIRIMLIILPVLASRSDLSTLETLGPSGDGVTGRYELGCSVKSSINKQKLP